MTDAVIIPKHRDRARVLRVVLSMLNQDFDGVVHVAAEARNSLDVDRFFVACVGVFVTALQLLHPDPVRHVEGWIAYELDQPEIPSSDLKLSESIVPSHAERATAMRAVLAALTENYDAVTAAAAEATGTERAIDRLLLALCDCLGIFLTSATPDPVTYVIGWLAVELELADAEDGS
jgi:hypothetical protein